MPRSSVQFYTTNDGKKSVRYRSADGGRMLPLIDGKTGDLVDLRVDAKRLTLYDLSELVKAITKACETA